MSNSHDSGPEFEKLSRAITEAVTTSEKVRKIVEEIQKKDAICPQSFMVLVLKMQVLTESMELKVDRDNISEKSATKKRSRKKIPEKAQYIDGRKLSEREVDFEDFLNERFDSKHWLKKNGLTF